MHTSFKILVPNLAYRYIYRFVILIGLLNSAIFGFIGYMQNSKLHYGYSILVLIATILTIIFQNANKFRKFKQLFYGCIYYSIIAAWVIQGIYWLAIPILILSFLEMRIQPTYYWVFNETQIQTQRYFPAKKIPWLLLQQVVLKDGLLKFDYRDNKLVYFNQLESTESAFTEQDFNAFCIKQIEQYPEK